MSSQRRPQYPEIDSWGVTHPGKVRPDNKDHFFLGSLTRGVMAEHTSIIEGEFELIHRERLASLGIVADGVGGSIGAEEAARRTVEDLVFWVSNSFHDAERREEEEPEVFSRLLHEAALAVHEGLVKTAERVGEEQRFATTLTLFLGLWPHAYLLQVGDSRCYILRGDELTQITRDQTFAQDLVDQGVMTQTRAEKTRWANVLSSAMGGSQAEPVVTRVVRDWGNVILLCSDGLTKHVSDERIQERLVSMTNARETVELLLHDAMEDGGTDNITMIVGRTLPPGEGPGR